MPAYYRDLHYPPHLTCTSKDILLILAGIIVGFKLTVF